jgi:hypothetical protein
VRRAATSHASFSFWRESLLATLLGTAGGALDGTNAHGGSLLSGEWLIDSGTVASPVAPGTRGRYYVIVVTSKGCEMTCSKEGVWRTPELIVLVRGAPEEGVLAACKTKVQAGSTTTVAAGCRVTGCEDCHDVENS